jgi:AraC-like DNA-binding protein
MRHFVLSTHSVPEADRLAYWREAVSEGLMGVSAEPGKSREAPFDASVAGSIGASLAHFRCRSVGYSVFRRPVDIARRGWEERIFLHREKGAGVRFACDRRELLTKPGDLMIADPTRPFATAPLMNFDHDLWFFPRKLFDPHLPASLDPRSLLLTGDSGLGRVVKAYLDSFAGQIDTLDDRELGLVAGNFCRLLAVACGAKAGEHQEAIGAARLAEARRYVDSHLADSGLTAEKAAAALRISLRQLHLLFEPSGETFARYVTRRRLEECRTALMTSAGRLVTDIALAWGFNSMPTFHRNFRQAFGASAGEVRGHAQPAE